MKELSFQYTIIRSNRKSLAIRIRPDGTVFVSCPLHASVRQINEIVRSKASWIEQKRNAIAMRPPALPFTEDELHALTMQAKKELPPLVARCAAQLGVSFGRITIRHQKSRWGSCSTKGNLNFNCLLMLAPPEVRSYVIVHELCHLKHMNHSARFWAEVEKWAPDYRESKQWLQTHGEALIRRLPQ